MHSSTRREFIQLAAAAVGAAATAAFARAAAPRPAWTIGCLNRPWVKWSADEMLDGIKAAGYRTIGLQTTTAIDPWVGSSATPEYLAALKEKIARRGLDAIEGRVRLLEKGSFAEVTADVRKQVANAKVLGLQCLINTGLAKPELYEDWYRGMKFATEHAAEHGIQIVVKPHGGVVATAADLQKCVEKINHPNLKLWYDAGNVIYYTGLDPLAELEPIVSHVAAFTAKDCAAKGSEVMIQFGAGKVDFVAILRRLKKAGFKGPIMVECCKVGATAAETTANAKANREFLEKAIEAV